MAHILCLVGETEAPLAATTAAREASIISVSSDSSSTTSRLDEGTKFCPYTSSMAHILYLVGEADAPLAATTAARAVSIISVSSDSSSNTSLLDEEDLNLGYPADVGGEKIITDLLSPVRLFVLVNVSENLQFHERTPMITSYFRRLLAGRRHTF